ncbi:MAG: RluA family pseudouridine synthase [Candidatus Poseidoniaceae archaeon]|nr:RluA family pseudouridine synthase [Candidatus Poseidoniaceae archaeon]
MKITIESEQSLIEVLSKSFPNSSKNKIRKMLTEGRISINGEIEHKAKRPLKESDVVEILDKTISRELTPPPKQKLTNLNIIFEDEDILLVEKPAGLLSIATNKMEPDTLHSRCVDYVKSKDPSNWCFIVHRLDRETSGIMLLAYSKNSKEYLQEQFAERTVYRTYHALVEGQLPSKRGTEVEWLLEDKNLRVKKVNPKTKMSKQAITHWEVMKENHETSLVRIMIDTGRRHQIRMAMKSLETPVVGDFLHGAETDPLGRICLHASSLEFLHPITDEPVRFETRVPFDAKS